MSAMESIDTRDLVSKAKQITQRELGVYMQRTSGSMKATERARKVMPMGVPSSFQAYDPHPIVVRRAQAAWMEDVDGNRYVDFDMGFGALVRRPLQPGRASARSSTSSTTARCSSRRASSTPTSPSCCATRYELPMWRFTNSRHRGDDGCHPRRPWRHRSGQDRQGRGRLPRPPRRGDDLDEATDRARPARPTSRRRSRPRRASPRPCSATPWSSRTTTPIALERALAGRRRRRASSSSR